MKFRRPSLFVICALALFACSGDDTNQSPKPSTNGSNPPTNPPGSTPHIERVQKTVHFDTSSDNWAQEISWRVGEPGQPFVWGFAQNLPQWNNGYAAIEYNDSSWQIGAGRCYSFKVEDEPLPIWTVSSEQNVHCDGSLKRYAVLRGSFNLGPNSTIDSVTVESTVLYDQIYSGEEYYVVNYGCPSGDLPVLFLDGKVLCDRAIGPGRTMDFPGALPSFSGKHVITSPIIYNLPTNNQAGFGVKVFIKYTVDVLVP